MEDDVGLRGQQEQVRSEPEPGQQADDQREGAVGIARAGDRAIEVPTPDGLQDHRADGRQCDPGQQLANHHRPLGQQAEDGQEHGGVDDERERQRAQALGRRPDASPDRQAAEHCRSDENGGEHHECRDAVCPRADRPALVESRHVPEFLERSAERQRDPQTGPQRSREAHREPERAARQRRHFIVQLGPDDGDAG